MSFSCGSKPTDLRTLVPAETLVYLETNDLGAALQPIVDSKPFNEVAKSKPDLSALRGVQLAVAVTGFETSEEKLTDEHSIGRVQPHFVAVADTHAWQFQTVRFAEQKLGSFVAEIYGSEPTLEKSEKGGGHYLVWTAKDGRKAFAVVSRNLIYFSNDETAIEKCLAVSRGEADSIAKTGRVPNASQETLASGYVSTDGIAQIANIVGLKFASEAGEDSEVQSAIAGILPQLLRNSITEIRWNASQTEQGIEDKYQITMPPDVSNVFNETMASNKYPSIGLFGVIPSDANRATLYNLKSPQVAWRSVLLVAQKQTDPLAGKMIAQMSGVLFEPYGVKDVESFLSSGPDIVTANFSPDSDNPIVVAYSVDPATIEKSLSNDLKRRVESPEYSGLRKNSDGDIAAFFDDSSDGLLFVSGDKQSVERIFNGRPRGPESGLNAAKNHSFDPNSASMTFAKDEASAAQIADMLSAKKSDDAKAESTYFTETRFTKTGMERRTVSDFGLIGSIIAQLAQD